MKAAKAITREATDMMLGTGSDLVITLLGPTGRRVITLACVVYREIRANVLKYRMRGVHSQ